MRYSPGNKKHLLEKQRKLNKRPSTLKYFFNPLIISGYFLLYIIKRKYHMRLYSFIFVKTYKSNEKNCVNTPIVIIK